MDESTYQAVLNVAQCLADLARTTSMKYFRTQLQVDTKEDTSPVTIADREVEQQMRSLLRAEFPAHGVCGEEFGDSGDYDYKWLLDPIDGTKPFVMGFPVFGSLITLLSHDSPLIGVIEIPATRERWTGTKEGTLFNGKTVRVGSCDSLSKARLAGTSPYDFSEDDCSRLRRIILKAAMHRFGGGCYSFGLLSNGSVDLVIEAGLEPWDYMALVPVVEGAGGVITDWSGKPLTTSSDGRVIASCTGALHDETLHLLNEPL